MKLELIDNKSDKLILFLTGWGCDANQVRNMKAKKYDVLIAYDYVDTKLDFDFSKYKEINLIAFSACVLMACVLKNKLPKLNKKIAFNGNPKNFDEYFGLPENVGKDFQSITGDTVVPFRRKYLVFDDKELKLCNYYHSSRGLEDSNKEFLKLEEYAKQVKEPIKFDLVMLSDSDKVFSLKRQMEYYKNQKCKVIRNCAHFPFYQYTNFDEIME